MHFKEVKNILSPQNGMNLFRGCTHGCIYCDSRSACYHMEHAFEDIEVKSNALSLLEQALKRKRRSCMLGMGSMSDPYLPAEKRLEYTRKSLILIEKYGFGVTLITKSDLVLRDLDVLKAINERAKCVVQVTLTTYDETLCKIVEPNVCATRRRAEVLQVLRDNNIPAVVWLCPILPFINDTEENLRGILGYCLETGVYGVINFGMGLTLREGSREYFYRKLDENFPLLKQRYRKEYGSSYELESKNSYLLNKIFKETCSSNGIVCDAGKIFDYLRLFPERTEQLRFF